MISEIDVPEPICPGCTGAPDSVTRAVKHGHQRCAEELWKLTMAPWRTNPATRWERHVQKETLGKVTFSILQAAISTEHGLLSSSRNPIAFFKRCYEEVSDVLERPAKALIMRLVISKKNLELLLYLIHRPHDDYCATFPCGKRGVSAMHLAAFGGDMRLVTALDEESRSRNELLADIEDKKNVRGENCFHAAVRGGHVEVARFLMNTMKMDASPASLKGIRPVHIAAEKGNLEMLRLLIGEGGTHPNPSSVYLGDCRWTHETQPVLLAAARGHWDCVEYLVSRGASTDHLFSVDFELHRQYRGAPVPCQLEVRFGIEWALAIDEWLFAFRRYGIDEEKLAEQWMWFGGE